MENTVPSASPACPKCSYPAPEGAIDCPACGVVYAKYRAPGVPLEHAASATVAANELFNPYAPPAADLRKPTGTVDVPVDDGVWRDGKYLVMRKDAVLPDRCLRCNRRSDLRLRKTLYWHRKSLYLLLLINVLVYALFVLLLRRRADIDLPLCHEHATARKIWIGIGVATLLAGVGLAGYGFSEPNLEVYWVLGFVVTLTAIAIVLLGSRPVQVWKMDDQHVWLEVSRDLLAILPDAPYRFEY